MKITKVFITGDTHGLNARRIDLLLNTVPELNPEETALIVLGDSGLNYYLDRKDKQHKREVEERGIYLYCVRGNHEARPKDIPDMKLVQDDFVNGTVWMEEDYPHIRYFTDWGIYNIMGLRTLVVGGAYSVDKHYRIQRGWRWFENEQLADFEMDACYRNTKDGHFDLVLAHTCPKSWQPTDLFLNCIDQSSVDDTMERWLDKLMNKIDWDLFLFGHYHADRIELPHVEQFFEAIESLEDIKNRWERYDSGKELDWWLPVSPKMKRIVEE
jgi:3-oxoacid CoA-transferase subunit A